MRARVLALGLLLGCSEAAPPPALVPVPGVLRQALSAVEDVEAEAALVPRGGVAGPGVALTRGDDGASFSGFLPAEPGDYRLAVVFTGRPMGGGARLFLGRWTSDAFTVASGDTATPTFSEALDVIGGPEDGGDLDGDGLGNLDELLFGADPRRADSDGDGLDDGVDCAPDRMEAEPYRIAEGGSVFDCDGDGVAGPDVPFGDPGMDCDDRAPQVSPRAEDDCATPLDEDCNPATCPDSDVEAPTLASWTPAEGVAVGCHARFVAEVQDDGVVASVQATLRGVSSGQDATLFLSEDGGQWVSGPLNGLSGANGLTPGTTTVVLEAIDGASNRLEETRFYDLQFDLPAVTNMTPSAVGGATGPVQIEISAVATLGLAAIELHRVAKSASGTYDVRLAERVGSAASSPGRFMVDPGTLDDGEYLLFPVVRDAVGNESRPSLAIIPVDGGNGLEVDVDYRCIASPTRRRTPVRVLVVGDAYAPATMGDLLPTALAQAQAADPGTELVQVVGFGVRPDGRVGLDDPASFTKRWLFGFRHPVTAQNTSVTWFTPAFSMPNPVVDPQAGNITGEVALLNPSQLPDSSAVLAAMAAQGQCVGVTGDDADTMIYLNQGGQNVVSVSGGGQTWRASASTPVTEIDDCQ